ncbi:TlpA family protein disulfide reductase [Metabacillus sp. GX 13764]|uniref:TlpA family protein disulfide reductase n=1 Tax=Metabacillus kandeliae TaxID=2900151 RepID=UPI001E371262|nr:TlpA disulfide reductase family protein [Metabacillus kandeliae]MCD7033652.1 TlpA family protein disulfide reductase [Metabacillus kandeliae]
MKKWTAILFIAALAGAALFQLLLPKDAPVGAEAGNKAPDFSLPSLDKQSARLADYKGQKVLINFWASWCGPCQKEMPLLKEYQQDHPEIKVLTINVTANEPSIENVRNFLKKRDLKFPVGLDYNAEVSGDYQVFSYPVSFFLDEQGTIKHIVRGELSKEDLASKF